MFLSKHVFGFCIYIFGCYSTHIYSGVSGSAVRADEITGTFTPSSFEVLLINHACQLELSVTARVLKKACL